MTLEELQFGAMLLTEHAEWSNEAIARECGFTDRSYFQRKFKELTGRTPAEWRTVMKT